MASIRVTSMVSFTDQDAGKTLVLIDPDLTPRPVGHWTVPQWWEKAERTIYAHCARVDDLANGKSIYIASSTRFPRILIEENAGVYTFDSDKTREYINRIWVTDDPELKTGVDYRCPLRRGDITQV